MDDVVIVGGGIIGVATAYFLSRKVYLDKQMIIVNQSENLAKSELEHKKRELAAISTNIVQENEQVSNILKDLNIGDVSYTIAKIKEK